jgi:glucuronoarabinoxylan endo-1,4-beta-xylanase
MMPAGSEPRVLLSFFMRRGLGGITLFVLLTLTSAAKAQTVTINWTEVHQTIDGFGTSEVQTEPFANWPDVTTPQADLLFDPTVGVGLSLLRIDVPPDGTYRHTASAQLAIARGARVWAAPFSPPPKMKSNHSITNGGYLLTGSYKAYANYLRNYVQTLQKTYGIMLYALSVQNEPDQSQQYASALWSARNIRNFVRKNLGPTFATAHLGTKIMIAEPSGWGSLSTYTDTTMNDSSAAAYVSIVAAHAYSGTIAPYPRGQGKGKALWETEVASFGKFDPSISDALYWTKSIHDYMTLADANSYTYYCGVGNNYGDNECLIESGLPAKRLYGIGNYSKFVRPGWVRIGATANPTAGVYVSAYKDSSSGNFATVALNQNGTDAKVDFVLIGFTVHSVTPWLTSASANLAQQPSILAGGDSFDATLRAYSITTFVGSGESRPSKPIP